MVPIERQHQEEEIKPGWEWEVVPCIQKGRVRQLIRISLNVGLAMDSGHSSKDSDSPDWAWPCGPASHRMKVVYQVQKSLPAQVASAGLWPQPLPDRS